MNVLSIIPNLFGGVLLTSIVGAMFWKPKVGKKPVRYLIVIVTVGTRSVLPALSDVVEKVEELGLDYVVLTSNPVPFKRSIVIPRERDGSKYRAIKYFVENYVEDDMWYVFLDDDSYPLDAGFLLEIDYYDRRGYVAGNGVLSPRPGKSKVAYALDWIRYFDDITRFRLANGVLHTPVFGLHGELLMVKGKVLREVWPSMEESITEDFRFAMELRKRGYKTFQVSTKVSIKSPNSLKDFIKQRARWANVIFDALAHRNILPLLMAVGGIMTNWMFFPLWFVYGFTLASLASAYWWGAYLYGSYKARANPLLVFMGSAAEIVGVLKGVLFRDKKFVVIDKS